MRTQTACEALRAKKCLELRYDGFTRVVEVHIVGLTKDRNELMHVWQVRGGSNSHERQGWKNMRLDEALSAHVIDEQSDAPRHGYKRNNPVIETVICQV